MGQSYPCRSTALVVEHDQSKRETIATLLKESDYDVISCGSGEAATEVLQRDGGEISFLLTEVELAGAMDGIELAHYARCQSPQLKIMVLSRRPLVRQLPDGSRFYARPWSPLDVLRVAML